MKRWPYEVKTYTQAEVQEYVNDTFWQQFRLGIKGMPTEEKLLHLDCYRYNRLDLEGVPGLRRIFEVQIDNYINALKRGGQLDLEGKVVR